MDIFSKLGISISGPFADVLDEAVRGIIKQFGLEDDLEKVSGDNERLRQVAEDYRGAARDMRGVVEDLQFERKRLNRSWEGAAADAFDKEATNFEKALKGEADDMDQIAELLETAAQACAEAEQMMIDLIIEIVEAALAAAATTAILSVLTAGAAAAIGPLIAAAGIAHKALKAVKITAKLADKLADLAKRMEALKKAEKLRKLMKSMSSKKDPFSHRNALKRYMGRGKVKENGVTRSLPGRQREDLVMAGQYGAAKRVVRKGIVTPIVGNQVGEPLKQGYETYGPEGAPGVAPKDPLPQDDSRSFEDRRNDGLSPKERVEKDFG